MPTEHTVHVIEQKFTSEEWSVKPIKVGSPLNLLVCNSYASVGVAIYDTVDGLLLKWRDCQDALSESLDDSSSDVYLLFVVPCVDAHYQELREVLNDTYVCRKLCIEIGNRPIEKALIDLPFFIRPGSSVQGNATGIVESAFMQEGVITDTLLEDLAKMSAENVLQNLIHGRYGVGEVRDESTKTDA